MSPAGRRNHFVVRHFLRPPHHTNLSAVWARPWSSAPPLLALLVAPVGHPALPRKSLLLFVAALSNWVGPPLDSHLQ